MMGFISCVCVAAATLIGNLPPLEEARLETFVSEVYGRRPVERPADLTFADLYPPEVFQRQPEKGPKRPIDARRRIVVCRYSGPYGSDSFRFTVFLPKDATKPVPAFVLICNRNPGVNIDPWRAQRTGFWPAEEIVDRGYAAIAFWNDEVAVDCYSSDYAFKAGVFRCFEDPSRPRADDAWGTLSAWAWGASRIMDWIETEPAIDAKHVAVVGHSRGGKAALVAGVTDSRFALAVSNGSGCGGAKLNHADLPESEHIGQILRSVPYWFCRNFAKYADRERDLPFDQHQWLSLMAPRLVYVASGSLDSWAGPAGEKLAVDLARPAWGERGATDVGYHVHEGKHDLTLYDWNRFLDFTDAHGWRNPAETGTAVAASAAECLVVPAHQFDAGGWKLDVQFLDVIGAPYLLAHGLGNRVADATATVEVPDDGEYRVWAYTRNWADGAPGRFKVAVDGHVLPTAFGAGAATWGWVAGDAVTLRRGTVALTLKDQTGFDGRCAGLALTRGTARPAGAPDPRLMPVSETRTAEFVVVGGGLPGTCAAVAAARRMPSP